MRASLSRMLTIDEGKVVLAVLINVGRAPVVAEEDLYNALRSKQIGGAFIDVWYGYPTPEDPERKPSRYPIWELDNVIMTPHCSSRSDASRERRWMTVLGARPASRELNSVLGGTLTRVTSRWICMNCKYFRILVKTVVKIDYQIQEKLTIRFRQN